MYIVHILVIVVFITSYFNAVAEVLEDPVISEECRKKGFCENVPNYPTDYVRKLVASLLQLVSLQVTDPVCLQLGDKVKTWTMESLDGENRENNQNQSSRIARSDQDLMLQLCDLTVQILYPQSAPNENNEWFTVMNLGNMPLQGFRAELCSTSGQPCSTAAFQDGHKGTCNQEFVYREMEAVDKDGTREQMSLKLPSGCSCILSP